MKYNKALISALYNVTAAYPRRSLISWDFPARIWKKSFEALSEVLDDNGIENQMPKSEWGHISIALVKPLDKEQRNKVMMAAPVFSSPVSIEGIDVLPGQEYSYIALKLKVGEEYRKYFEFLIDLLGDENVDKPRSYPEFRPHASIATTSLESFKEVEKLIPEMEKAIHRYTTSFTPKQVQIWDSFQISEIEENILR